VLAATTYRDYIDFRAFKEISAEARCFWLGNMQTIAAIYPTKFIGSTGVLEVSGKPTLYRLNLEKPQEILGGEPYKNLYNTRNLIALKAPKSLRREG